MAASMEVVSGVATPAMGNWQALVLLLFPEVDPVSGSSLSCMMLKPGFCRQSQEKEPVGVREGGGIHREELARERDPFNLYIKDWTHRDL